MNKPNENSILKRGQSPGNKKKLSWGGVKISEYFKASADSPQQMMPFSHTIKTIDQFEREKLHKNEPNNFSFSDPDIEPAPKQTTYPLDLFHEINSNNFKEDDSSPQFPPESSSIFKHEKAPNTILKATLLNELSSNNMEVDSNKSTPINNKLISSISPADKPTFVREFNNKKRDVQECDEMCKKMSVGSLFEELSAEKPNDANISQILRSGEVDIRTLHEGAMTHLISKYNLYDINIDICHQDCQGLTDTEITQYQMSVNNMIVKTNDYIFGNLNFRSKRAKNLWKMINDMNDLSESISSKTNTIRQQLKELDTSKRETVTESLFNKVASNDIIFGFLQNISGYGYAFGWKINSLESFVIKKSIHIECIPFNAILQIGFQNNPDIGTLSIGNP